MKLKRFNPQTVKSVRTGKATIRFAKQGQISLSGKLVQQMKLKEGDKIEIVQDEDDLKNWFVVKSKNGFELRGYKGANGKNPQLMLNNAAISNLFIKSLDKTEKSIGCLVASEPTLEKAEELWPIITSSAK